MFAREYREVGIRPMILVFVVGAVAGCRQPNPRWLGPAEGESSAGADTTAGTTAVPDMMTMSGATDVAGGDESTSDEATETTGAETGPPPSECAPPPTLGSGACPSECDECADGRCRIQCMEDRCDSTTTSCPPGWPCDVVCDSKDACKVGTIKCHPDHECTIECQGDGACEDAVVECGSMPCTVNCGSQDDACTNLRLECGASDSQVQCAGASEVNVSSADGACACTAEGC